MRSQPPAEPVAATPQPTPAHRSSDFPGCFLAAACDPVAHCLRSRVMLESSAEMNMQEHAWLGLNALHSTVGAAILVKRDGLLSRNLIGLTS